MKKYARAGKSCGAAASLPTIQMVANARVRIGYEYVICAD
jgi:hypothetical protein